MKGYYKCVCGEEYLTKTPHPKWTCEYCGKTITLTKQVSDEKAKKIMKSWLH